jgi:hypothetical protein
MKSGLPSHIVLSLALSSLSGIVEGATVVKSGAKCGKIKLKNAIYKRRLPTHSREVNENRWREG